MGSVGNKSITDQAHTPEQDACRYAMQLATIVALPMTLRAAIELDLFEIIAKAGPNASLTPAEISSQLPTENPKAPEMLDRILSLLASYDVLGCSMETGDDGKVVRKYGVVPVTNYFTKNEDGMSLAAMAILDLDKVVIDSWYCLKDAILDGGIPFKKAHGVMPFQYAGTIEPRFGKVFNEAMRNNAVITMNMMLEIYGGFDGLEVLVDVGGGVGGAINMILKKHTHIKGINFDLPHVVSQAPAIPGVDHVGGDMFESVPNGDAIFIKSVLHDWGDEDCVKLLKNCQEALPPHGKVILMECVLPAYPEPTTAARGIMQADVTMLMAHPGGKERTEKELESLAKEAGFYSVESICNAANFWLLEFYK